MAEYDHGYKESLLTDPDVNFKEPVFYLIILYNDDYTTMDFVIEILEQVFNKTPSEATQIMLKVHRQGKGICGRYPAEIAETKVMLVNKRAKESGFPLKCSMEKI